MRPRRVAAAVLLPPRPGRRAARATSALRRRPARVGRSEHERGGIAVDAWVGLRAQALDRSGQGELRAAEVLDEVAAAADPEGLEVAERVVQRRKPPLIDSASTCSRVTMP